MRLLLAILLVILTVPASAEVCGAGPTSAAPIAVDLDAPMVAHTVSFTLELPAERFNAMLASTRLESILTGTDRIPAVVGTRPLTDLAFGQPGAPRLVCLADGSTVVEDVLENAPGRIFRYVVWRYTSPLAKPIDYALGEFALTPIDSGRTRVDWTYRFRLKPDTFPGWMGGPGRWLFGHSFVRKDFARMMEASARNMSAVFR